MATTRIRPTLALQLASTVRVGLLAASLSAPARGTTARLFIPRLVIHIGGLDPARSLEAQPMSDMDLSAEASTVRSLSAVAVAVEVEMNCQNRTAGNFQCRPFLFFGIAAFQSRA